MASPWRLGRARQADARRRRRRPGAEPVQRGHRPRVGAAELEARYLDLVADVRAAVAIPLAVKLSPFFTALANFAVRVEAAGADGLVLFNRFYQPDLDLDSLDVVPSAGAVDLRGAAPAAALIAILFGRVGTSLAATTGVHTGWTRPRCCWPGRTWP